MTTFYLVRHGEATYDLAEQRRLKGHSRDLMPLTERGVAQVEAKAVELRDVGCQVLLSSPMTRALQSAAIFSRRLDLPIIVDYDLREWAPDLTFTYDTVAVVEAAGAEFRHYDGEWPPGETRSWEPLSAVRERVLSVLRQYLRFERALVVCHGTVICAVTDPWQTIPGAGVRELQLGQ